ncbi:MAG TPA: SiaB family protein kinase [Salinivirgaceae bacterium]|nr:SiaB family protein kinase [Salinivirgaceae bacterium]HQA76173.1 SiaB family protein kinase [Salinivirgaceae bacterium]
MFSSDLEKRELAFELYDGFKDSDLSYVYHGHFSQKITDLIIMMAETTMNQAGESARIKKRVFSIMVESLQNITRHQDVVDEHQGLFAIEQKDGNYFVTTVNHIFNSNIEHVDGLLKKIQSLQAEDLKLYYKEVLTENEISEKGGAGLGLIEIAKKSNNKISYHFHKIDDVCSYFYFHTCITPREEDDSDDTELVRIDNIFFLHQLLKQKEVQLIYNGIFNQENLINLLNIIENQMEGMGHIKRIVFNMMVEMIQNIVKHALRNDERKGNPGIFFINKKNGMHVLNTGNYILKKNIDEVKSKIDYVNSLNHKELDDYYNKCLFDFQIDSPKESGLGFIELKMKSSDKIRYTFQDIDDKKSFFILQIYIE